jgi:hypothetical protein
MKLVTFFLWFIFLLGPHTVFNQCSIGDPGSNAPSWDEGKTIETNFNDARRWEETNRGLTPNCLGNMTAPSGGWAGLSNETIALYIHNSERTARSLLPLYGVETNLSSVAQAHADWQITNDVFSHGGNPALGSGSSYLTCPLPGTSNTGSSFDERINSNSTLNGQWQGIAENLSVSVATSSGSSFFTNFVARSIYGLMYQDAGSAWGHRHAILNVFTDNHGPSGSEGFIGVGVGQGANFQAVAFNCNNWNYAMILTLEYYDPFGSATGFSFSVLPVELTAFSGWEENGQVQLAWTTQSERNSDYFVVEKSQDGRLFEAIGNVEAAGFSLVRIDYSFADPAPGPGANYYRLRQVDFDGTVNFSKVIEVWLPDAAAVAVYPNPFQEFVHLKLPHGLTQPGPGDFYRSVGPGNRNGGAGTGRKSVVYFPFGRIAGRCLFVEFLARRQNAGA